MGERKKGRDGERDEGMVIWSRVQLRKGRWYNLPLVRVDPSHTHHSAAVPHTQTHTHTHPLSLTHTLSLSLSHTHTHTHTHSLSLSLSLSDSLTHTLSLSVSLSLSVLEGGCVRTICSSR